MLGRFLIALGLLLLATIGWIFYAVLNSREGELFDYRGWSVLQGMKDPPSASSSIVLVRKEEFAVVGFRGVGQPTVHILEGIQPHWSWVLLNEHHGAGEIKQMPTFGSYDLPCSDLNRIAQKVRDADPYAIKYLRSICS